MRLVVTNAHKNPIVFDAPWLFAEDEEAILSLALDPRGKRGESVQVNVPHSVTDSEPVAVVTVGVEWGDEGAEFYVDVSSDSTESTERIYSLWVGDE